MYLPTYVHKCLKWSRLVTFLPVEAVMQQWLRLLRLFLLDANGGNKLSICLCSAKDQLRFQLCSIRPSCIV